ncbi:hypothetical protein PFLmoz3_02013 [Pseudomonas fluorescens]|uniref:Uncharacterized protein n=1 Tax=Pseudomonas fluorescens TaxID=294 RepID=A0A125QIY3_PSEFL|nr:hypothetical protein PFLmoz3_02013 [Pseudomonas fluorescens]
MPGIGHFVAGQVANKVRLAHQLEQITNTRRQAPLMFGQACAVSRQARHRVRGQRRHAFFRGTGFEQLGELLQALVDHGDVFVEVHQYAEHLLEVRVGVLQGVIQLARADDDHLDLQGNHLRVEGHGGQAAEFAQRRFHLQLARLQGTFERIPHKRLAEHFFGFQDQETAVGAVQRAGTQLAIGGVERALVGAVFDTAEQVVVGRVRFKHHRRATVDRVAHYQARAVLLLEQLARLGVGLGVVHQLLDHGFEQVHLHGLQVATDARIFCVFFRQWRQQRLQRQGDGFFVELAQLVVGLALPLRQAGQLFVEAFFQLGDIGVEALAIGLRQLRKLGFVQRLAVEHRRKGDIGAVAVQRHVFFQGQALDHVQRLVVALVERPVDGAFTLLISRVLEHRREGGDQVIDQAVDIGNKRRGGATWQFQGAGLAGLIEIIHINPVRRGLQALAFGFEVAFDERKAAGARLAHDKHVVTGAWHGHAELQGFNRTFLAKHTAKGLQIIGGREAELFSGERASQRFGR